MKRKSFLGKKVNRVKLYKKGKLWIAASVTSLAVGITNFLNTSYVKADILNNYSNKVDFISNANVRNISSANTTQNSVASSANTTQNSVASSASTTKNSAASLASVVNNSAASLASVVNNSAASLASVVNNSAASSASVVNNSAASSASVVNNSAASLASVVNNSTASSASVVNNSAASSASVVNNSAASLASVVNNSTASSANTIKNSAVSSANTIKNSAVSAVSAAKSAVSVTSAAKSAAEISLLGSNESNDFATDTSNIGTYSNVKAKTPKDGSFDLDSIDDPYYGTWTFYFVTESGDMLAWPVGYVDTSSEQAKENVIPIVQKIEQEGYSYSHYDASYDSNEFYSYNYVTIVFNEEPLVQGGQVIVNYVDSQTGKILQTGIANYEDENGNSCTIPYIGDTYTTSPINIPGYTLTKTPSNADGTITQNKQVVTYEYTPNREQAKIQIIDETENGKVLNTITVDGTYGSTSTFDISSYLNENYPNYNVESNNWPGSIAWNNSNDGTIPEYQVKLTHKYTNNIQEKTVTQIIKYQYSDGVQAESPKKSSITFSRSYKTDLVTGDVTYGSWVNKTGINNFPSVVSPQIQGYTASYSSSSPVINVTADTPDNVQVITYIPNKESMTIVYYDIDEHKILRADTLQGNYNTSPSYDYQRIINHFKNEGYNVAKDTIPTSGLIFNNASNQQYEVDLTHTTTILPANSEGLTKVIKHTIYYVDSAGKALAPDVIQTITYTRSAIKDNVTGAIKYSDWTTTSNPAEFPSVKSPSINGYTPNKENSDTILVNSNSSDSSETIVYTKNSVSQNPIGKTTTVTETINYISNSGVVLHAPTVVTITFKRSADGTYIAIGNDDFPKVAVPQIEGYAPDILAIPEINNVEATDANIVKTVVYNPVKSSITITYYDETSNKVIKTNVLTGQYNSSPNYDADIIINALEKNGYKEVSSNLPSSLIYTNNSQSYTVNFEHTYTTSTQNSTVTQTINYNYADGSKAANSIYKELTFSRKSVKDNVTGNIQYGPWIPASGEFPSVKSPVIIGYTPSEMQSKAVSDVTGSTSNNVQNIIYNANQEQIKVNYIDQTTGKIITTVVLNGAYNSTSSYTTTNEIKKLENQGYVLVQNGYPSNGAKFDQDGVLKTYNVILKENIVNYTESKLINQTIHYVDQSGNKLAPDKTSSVTFTRSVSVDEVTGVKKYGNWTPNSQTFSSVTSPKITGYTVVSGEEASRPVTVNENSKNNVQVITYVPNQESAIIQYIDKTDNKVLSSVTLNGAYGTANDYNPATTIQKYVNEGYKVLNDDFPANGIVFDYDGIVPVYKITFTHNTRTNSIYDNPDNVPNSELTRTIYRTINYVYSDGKKAAKSVINEVIFNRNVVVDQVTHKIISKGNWTPNKGSYPIVTSPTITGYTPNTSVINSDNNVLPNDNNSTIIVTYTANKEHAVVNYVDDTTGQIVASQTVNGTFGSTVTYDPTSEEQALENKGYVIGSNNLPSGNKITFTQDGQVPTYTVHLSEGTTSITPSNNPDGLDLTHEVSQTIHYVYSDGKQAAPDATTHITFHRNATKNNVTGKITYTNWAPTSQTFPAVKSPTITGYTPNEPSSTAVTVNEGSTDNEQTIIYTANKEHAVVNYVDDTTGNIIIIQTIYGAFGSTVMYNPANEEKTLESEGYIIGNNNLPSGNKITFTQDGQVPTYTVHLSEGTTSITPSNNPDGLDLTHEVNQTIHYVYSDGKQAAPDAITHITFHRNATKNNVTGKITYTNWAPTSQTFPAVKSPMITGYTPNEPSSTAVTVNEGSTDNEQTITYTANKEYEQINNINTNVYKDKNDENINHLLDIENYMNSNKLNINKSLLSSTNSKVNIDKYKKSSNDSSNTNELPETGEKDSNLSLWGKLLFMLSGFLSLLLGIFDKRDKDK